MFAKVLVPINPDDREIASAIVPHVRWLVDRLAPEMVILAVIPVSRTEDGPETARIFDRAESDVALLLDDLVRSIGGPVLESDKLVEFGSPAETIVDTCSRLGCDLIAMSTHGGGLLAQALAGSVTTEVMGSAQVPVLVINPSRSDDQIAEAVDISTVYVALDGTPEAEAVIPQVEFLATKLGLEVVLLQATNEIAKPSTPLAEPAVVVTGDATFVSIPEVVADPSIDYFTRLVADLTDKGIDARWILLEGTAKERLVGVFEESLRSMIAVTRSGKSGLKRWIAGSVPEELIKRTGSPVLIVPPALQPHLVREA